MVTILIPKIDSDKPEKNEVKNEVKNETKNETKNEVKEEKNNA